MPLHAARLSAGPCEGAEDGDPQVDGRAALWHHLVRARPLRLVCRHLLDHWSPLHVCRRHLHTQRSVISAIRGFTRRLALPRLHSIAFPRAIAPHRRLPSPLPRLSLTLGGHASPSASKVRHDRDARGAPRHRPRLPARARAALPRALQWPLLAAQLLHRSHARQLLPGLPQHRPRCAASLLHGGPLAHRRQVCQLRCARDAARQHMP